MVAIASVFLLQILDYNFVHVKWKEEIIFAAINTREFFLNKRSDFMMLSHAPSFRNMSDTIEKTESSCAPEHTNFLCHCSQDCGRF